MRDYLAQRPWLFIVALLALFVTANLAVLIIAQTTGEADRAHVSSPK